MGEAAGAELSGHYASASSNVIDPPALRHTGQRGFSDLLRVTEVDSDVVLVVAVRVELVVEGITVTLVGECYGELMFNLL